MEVKPGYKRTEVGAIPEEWLAKSLGELGKWKGGMTPSMRNPDYWLNGTIPWISSGDMKFVHLKETGSYITNEAVKHGSTTMLPAGSIVMVTRSGILRKYLPVATNLIPMAINQDIKALLLKNELSSSFILHAITESGPRILSQCMKSGTTVESIEFKWLKAFFLAIPPLPEQRAIATVLSDIDELLNSLDRIIAKKRDLKQAAMQQLLTGQKRLPGFSGEWVLKRLGDIAHVSKGAQLKSDLTDEAGKFAHLNGGITPSGYTDKSNTDGNTIAISEGGNSCGFVQFMTQPYWCGGHCYSVIHDGVDNHFLYQALKGRQSEIMGLRVGSGLPNVQKTGLINFKIHLPKSAAEQIAIAEVLTKMDDELSTLMVRRDKTSVLKQGMMQELLTGRTRLVALKEAA